MPKEPQQYNTEVTEFDSVLHTDNDPLNQPRNTHRFALNAVNESIDGQQKSLSNERANFVSTTRPDGYEIIGDKYIEDDTSVLILTNSSTGQDEIALLKKDGKYYTLVNTSVLGLKITNQCDIIYRLRRGKERVIYWVDSFNKARTFNLDRPQNFYNQTYLAYLQAGGDPNTFVGEKWDGSSFDLIKSYSSVPFFSNVEILETGNILPGSYNFAIQYIDQDLNPTEWISTSNTVNIYNDSTNLPFYRIRGSRNVDTTSQSFPRANKSIKLTITNLDNSFPYYRIAIIRAAGNTGQPDKTLASDLYSTSESNFLYTGNDGNLSEVSLEDILIDKEIIFAPQHIEQLENRLILANTKGKSINWCEFQKYASKISSDLALKEILLNNVSSEPNIKNAKSTFLFRGNMPGEVYSYGVCYLFDDGFISPAFHIPGKSSTNTTSRMKVYEIDEKYLDIHNCSTNNYWGVDSEGNTLLAKKIRHHRFPFRKEVNEPLYGSTGTVTNVTRYRLKLTLTLNPAWTPGPIAYPVDGSGLPLAIPYIFNYQINGSTSTSQFNGQLVDTDMGVPLTAYDDVVPLDLISGPDYFELDTSSILYTTYQTPGNERFIITGVYDSYIASTSFNDDKSNIFGIEFSNIERPHPNVVGFYIVRNERLDDDRLILDNAIFGAVTEFEQYKSFGLIMPKDFYHVNNCGRQADAGKSLAYSNKTTWFFNPEFQYFGNKSEFDDVEIEGTYSENVVSMPTISNVNGSSCNGGPSIPFINIGGSKGVYINDVQAGTSYDPGVNKKKDKDDDGFDLIIGYRNTTLNYTINKIFAFPSKKRVLYINAASYQNLDDNTYYNVSTDNKIGFYTFDNTILTSVFYNPATRKNNLLYGALIKSSTSAYSNFMTRAYYKEHSNPIMFGNNTIVNNIKIFNGDTQISAFNFVSTVFYDMVVADRAKKSKLWKIILGGVLLVAGVLLAIPSAGASLGLTVAAATSLSALAISYGVSLAMSGIKFEQFKSMIDEDYEKGLKETVTDGGVFETVRDTIEREDDTIRWFADRVSNIYMESTIPFGLRSGLTSGTSDFTDSPAGYDELGFRSYLIEKLTVIDRDQGSGRLYKGYASSEVYDMNRDYMRFNKEKRFSHLPIEYDCCSDSNEVFPLRRWFSEQSFQEERIDNYRVFLPNNYSDMEGEHGEITDMFRLGNNLYMHTREALWQQPANLQERVTNEIVSFIGTGAFLNIPPRKVIDSILGSGGSQHKWATIKTDKGVAFLNEIEGKIYLYGERPAVISSTGMESHFKNNLKSFLSKQLYDKFGVNFLLDNNPANQNGIGYISTYDTRYKRLIFTKRDYYIIQEKLDVLILTDTIPVSGIDFKYNSSNGLFYQGTTQILFSNSDYFENRSWTISYSFSANRNNGGFISNHSYIPNYYIHTQNNVYSVIYGNSKIWKHNQENRFQTYYDIYFPYIVEYVPKTDLDDKIIEGITLYTKARRYDNDIRDFIDEHFITFDKALLYNSKQSSGEKLVVVKNTQINPQDWYAQQVVNTSGTILAARKGRNWNINNFKDYVDDYTVSLFSSKWDDIKVLYFIDKVINPASINLNKDWSQLSSFKDKYIIIRLKFDSFDDVNLILNYSLETEQTFNP